MFDVWWGTSLSHPVSTAVQTELLDGWGTLPEETSWWLLTVSHPITGMHPQPGWATAPEGSWTPTCPEVGPHFSP